MLVEGHNGTAYFHLWKLSSYLHMHQVCFDFNEIWVRREEKVSECLYFIWVDLVAFYLFLFFEKIHLLYFYFPNTYYVRKVLQSTNYSTLRFWYIDIFWGLLNSFMLFLWWCMCMYVRVCVRVCTYACIWVNRIASKRCIRLSSNLVCILQVNVGRTLLILMNIGCIVFLEEF